MEVGELVRLRWATQHPTGRVVLRDDTVIVEDIDDETVTFRWPDEFAAVRIRRAVVLDEERVA